ncbi:Urease accessory protein UreD [Acetivibrio thermocellus BC1]|nr:Urease accessory protein UreD [Acetivibrio thermocellus BC1]
MKNKFGKESRLYIRAKVSDGKTCLQDSYFTAPFKIAKPFYEGHGGFMNLMVMSASAGVMEGDNYRIEVELDKGARVKLEGQSYQKIHRMKNGTAVQYNSFTLADGAFLDYAPNPTIPFADSAFYSNTECRMEEGSAFIYSEILAAGRVKSGEIFRFREYHSGIKIYYGWELIFLENQFLFPKVQNLEGIGFFEGFTHQASMGFFCKQISDELIDKLCVMLTAMEDVQFGLSKTKKYGFVVRILGNSSDRLESILKLIRNILY